MRSSTDEIKSRLDILDVLKEYLQVKQAGSSWKALCPFHSEKTPSFFISPDRGVWHCFGCGEGGDLFSFIMRLEGMEFPEALRMLAERAGVELRPEERSVSNERTRLLDLNRVAMEFFEHALKGTHGAGARAYLEKRGLDEPTRAAWNIGFAPESWDALLQYLRAKGFRDREIVQSGLVVEKTNTRFYDRFRNRIMFPVLDLQGRVVGFGGRILESKEKKEREEPKYVNTPETPLYEKGKILFGLHRAKEAIRKEGVAVLVEGYMDVIASHRADVATAVATAGTALTQEHLKLLSRYTSTVAMSFDMDEAGERAAFRSVDLVLQAGLNLRTIVLPRDEQGHARVKDPDECVQKLGANVWQQAVAHATPFLDYIFDRVCAKADLTKAHEKKRVAKELLGHIMRLPDRVEQSHYMKRLAETVNVTEAMLWEALPKPKNEHASLSETASASAPLDRTQRIIERLLGFLLVAPEHMHRITKTLTSEMIEDPKSRSVYTTLVILATRDTTYHHAPLPTRIALLKERLPDEETFLQRLLFLHEQEGERASTDFEGEIESALRMLRERHVTQELRILEVAMREAEAQPASGAVRELVTRFQQLTEELASLHRQG